MPDDGRPASTRGHRLARMTGRDPGADHRAASPLELLFDLTFVVAFGQAADELAHLVVDGHAAQGVLGFVFAVGATCWAWINFSWFASAYDTDDWLFRITTLVQMIGVVVFTLGLPAMFESLEAGGSVDNGVLVAGYVVMRVAMIAQWLRVAVQDPDRQRDPRELRDPHEDDVREGGAAALWILDRHAEPLRDHGDPHDHVAGDEHTVVDAAPGLQGPEHGREPEREDDDPDHLDQGQDPEQPVVRVVGRREPGEVDPGPARGADGEDEPEDPLGRVAVHDEVRQLVGRLPEGDDEREVEEQLQRRGSPMVRPRVAPGHPREAVPPGRRWPTVVLHGSQCSFLITKNEPRIVPASLDFCRANLKRSASSSGTSMPSDSLNPTARFAPSARPYSTLMDSPDS